MATAARCRRPRSCAGDWPRRQRHCGLKAPRWERPWLAPLLLPPPPPRWAPRRRKSHARLSSSCLRGAHCGSRNGRERDLLTLRPPPRPPFWLFFLIILFFKLFFFAPFFFPCSAPGSLPATRTAVPPGEAGALRMRLPGTGGADSRSGFIDSRLLPSSPKQPGLVPVRIANCREQ